MSPAPSPPKAQPQRAEAKQVPTIHERIAKARNAGLTLPQVAKALGIPFNTLHTLIYARHKYDKDGPPIDQSERGIKDCLWRCDDRWREILAGQKFASLSIKPSLEQYREISPEFQP